MRYKVIKKLQYNDVVLGEEGDIVDVSMPTRSITNYKTGAYATCISDRGLKKIISDNLIPYVENDNVNHPSHYADSESGIECIDAMIAAYGKEAVMCFCKCNAFKYQWRFDKKNGDEDLKKSQWYQNKYMELKNGTDKSRT